MLIKMSAPVVVTVDLKSDKTYLTAKIHALDKGVRAKSKADLWLKIEDAVQELIDVLEERYNNDIRKRTGVADSSSNDTRNHS